MKRHFVGASDLIVDLGMNSGDDTEYYLKKGYRVVSVEANPTLCERAKERFREAIDTKRLMIRNVAIWSSYDKKPFYVNVANDHWSSLDRGWAARDASSFVEIQIDCIPIKHLFAHYGVPLYIKIDIEGADDIAIKQLRESEYLPLYLSLEDCRFGFEYLETLKELGYQSFKLLNQSTVEQLVDQTVDHRFKLGSSGPFGEDVPGAWLTYDEMVGKYSREVRDRNNNRHAPRTVWWDIHCRGSLIDAMGIT